MKLTRLISILGIAKPAHVDDCEVSIVTADSRQIKKNAVFVAIKGACADGHRFIEQAVRAGASLMIVQEPVDERFADKTIVVADTRRALALLAVQFHGDPSAQVKVIGVTGTNGKTTITYLLESLLAYAGRKPAVIGTINCRFAGTVIDSKNTTPGASQLQELLASMRDAGATDVVMEVSSHALDQARTEGVRFDSAIFTNLTQDHLDYHKDFEHYFQAKAKLFTGLASQSHAFINRDDEYAQKLIALSKGTVVTYGIDTHADVMACDIHSDEFRTRFTVRYAGGSFPIITHLIGRHNVYNILAAVSFALKETITPAMISACLEAFSVVPGRLERIDSHKGFSIVIDYAHTDDALRNVITSLRQICRGRLIVVFGCGGDRDKGKRPKMGSVVTELADFAIVTSDNPRSEDPQSIINDITRGITGSNYIVVVDRKEAIRKALAMAVEFDIILLAGKGHETYQVMRNATIHFDEREVICEWLQSAN
ncbi:MAG TPA: UDP-N-acetylmuramoyl-L-alanyl-D-glutamate--2,6-diaminopimelate ligase [Candidatus Omnitrophota bacterium]|nr:UDP-N-acetylmuramoyl-L-alanyl-D-glutamate--2,6-diaminopimelate ligase [Candidatus Omnitrophota bacterium]HPT06886.1 UDP-N-acetylmuramoyl-L-alanyl-D-glutamate--2,6-diaminopimelate ligase [Candidatus Omnitrophota bacterium]